MPKIGWGAAPDPAGGEPPDPPKPLRVAQKGDPSALKRLRRMYTLSVLIFLASYEVSNLYYFKT
jgi:hypothetical protein